MTPLILADMTGGGDGLTMSVAAITALGVAVAAVIKAYKAGIAKGENSSSVTLKKPVPTIQTREEPLWATKPELEDHVGWTRDEFKRVWGQFGTERQICNQEFTQIHERVSAQSLATAELKGSVDAIAENVSRLLDIATGKTTGNNSAKR